MNIYLAAGRGNVGKMSGGGRFREQRSRWSVISLCMNEALQPQVASFSALKKYFYINATMATFLAPIVILKVARLENLLLTQWLEIRLSRLRILSRVKNICIKKNGCIRFVSSHVRTVKTTCVCVFSLYFRLLLQVVS